MFNLVYRGASNISNTQSIRTLSLRKDYFRTCIYIYQIEEVDACVSAFRPRGLAVVYSECGNGVDGGTWNELRSLATENVDLRLLGFRRDIPAMIKASDIGAIPSIREGLGLAGIESLAAGVPVVGADVQGIRDYMENGRTGYLCDPYDASAFASAIQKLVTERNILATDCRQITQNFDISVPYAEVRAIYQEMLGVSIAASGNLLKSGDNDSGTEGEIETNCP